MDFQATVYQGMDGIQATKDSPVVMSRIVKAETAREALNQIEEYVVREALNDDGDCLVTIREALPKEVQQVSSPNMITKTTSLAFWITFILAGLALFIWR